MPLGFPVTFATDDFERCHIVPYEIENADLHHSTYTVPGSRTASWTSKISSRKEDGRVNLLPDRT